jgi:hypothetical protein
MLKITLGLVTALMLAACSYAPPQTASAAPLDGHTSGVGHPSNSYPGPRLY